MKMITTNVNEVWTGGPDETKAFEGGHAEWNEMRAVDDGDDGHRRYDLQYRCM